MASVAFARERADRIRQAMAAFVEAKAEIIAAYHAQDWKALEYDSWASYVRQEFGTHLMRLTADERKAHAAALQMEGMSVQAIAPVLGVHRSTVYDDLARGGNPTQSPNQVADQIPPATPDLDGDIFPDEPEPIFREPKYEPPAPPPARPAPRQAPPPPPPARNPRPQPAPPPPATIDLYTHDGRKIAYPEPKGRATFNQSEGDGISWAKWSWNPVTGCLHGCEYCYARAGALSERMKPHYPAGFTPLFHHERLDAPANTAIPVDHRNEIAPCRLDGCPYRRVFVCSMADLYGRWVPDEWIAKVHASMLGTPDWEYLLLTKFPARYVGLELPPSAWVGTSVDEQKRVRIAEDAFRKIDGVKVKWLSLEPLREPLQFTDLSMFDWVVIGAQTATRQPTGLVPAFSPRFEWFDRIYHQAKEAGCKVHIKPNLITNPGMIWPDEYPTDR